MNHADFMFYFVTQVKLSRAYFFPASNLHIDLIPVLVSKDLPSGEDDGSTPWPPVSESTSKGTENMANLAILCERFVYVSLNPQKLPHL